MTVLWNSGLVGWNNEPSESTTTSVPRGRAFYGVVANRNPAVGWSGLWHDPDGDLS